MTAQPQNVSQVDGESHKGKAKATSSDEMPISSLLLKKRKRLIIEESEEDDNSIFEADDDLNAKIIREIEEEGRIVNHWAKGEVKETPKEIKAQQEKKKLRVALTQTDRKILRGCYTRRKFSSYIQKINLQTDTQA